MIIEEINNHSSFEESIKIVKVIDRQITRLPHQHIHILYMLREIMKEKCKVYLEIGTYWGGSLTMVMQSKFPCRFLSIDTNEFIHEYKGSIDKNVAREDIVKNFISLMNIHNHEFNLIVGNSLDPKIFTQTKVLANAFVDLFFIDGLHETRQVINDFNTYFPLVREGGIIVFDDYLTKRGVKEAVDFLIEKNIDKRFVSLGSPKNFIKSSTFLSDVSNNFIVMKIIENDHA